MTYLRKLKEQHHTVHWAESLNQLKIGTQLFLQPTVEGLEPKIVTFGRLYVRNICTDCFVDAQGKWISLDKWEYEIWVIAQISDEEDLPEENSK